MSAETPNSNARDPNSEMPSTFSDSPEPVEKKSAGAARGLADLMDSLLGGSRLRRSGVPTKAAAAEQEEPPELLDLLLEGPDAVVVLHREHGEIIEANHRFAEWVGIDRAELDGKRFLDLFPEPERKAARTLFEDAGAGGVHVMEVPCATKGSRPRLVEFTSAASKSGGGAFAIVVGRDVGERAATERYLRAERDRLSLFIRAMRDMLILLSPAGDILYANAAAEQVFEPFELPVICHRWLNELAKFDHSDLQGLASAYEGRTLELEAGDGSTFLVTRSFIFESGQKAMVMLMAKDITEQRIIEKQNHQLEIELIRESKLAEFGTLSAGIAHNLNGPLTGVLGFCDLIELTKPGQSEIAQIRNQALAMKDIIANLLHKSRSEREVQPQDLLIEEIIHTELRFLEANLFFKHDVKKIVDLDPDSPTIYGVYIDFSQVIGNLLRNAIDAMHKSEKRELVVRTRSTDMHLIVTISDSGCGIPDDIKRKLFQPFFTTKPKSQDAKPGEPTGTGLGLSTSRSILARYGAEIAVESTPGEGSTFTVTIPRNRKPIS
jgi:two-component system NtrC family sensor kinase